MPRPSRSASRQSTGRASVRLVRLFLPVVKTWDWLDGKTRRATMSNSGRLLLNALQYRAPAAVPEPASLLLLGMGAGLIARRIRKRRATPACQRAACGPASPEAPERHARVPRRSSGPSGRVSRSAPGGGVALAVARQRESGAQARGRRQKHETPTPEGERQRLVYQGSRVLVAGACNRRYLRLWCGTA